MQAQFAADYKEALVTVKEEMRESEGEEIEDEMQGEIRKWFFAERDDQGKFPDYPSDDEGGSVAIFHPERLVANGNGANAGGGGGGGGEEAEQQATKKSDGGGEERKKKGGKGGSDAAAAEAAEGMEGEHDEAGFVLKSTEYVRQLRSGHKLFEGNVFLHFCVCYVQGRAKERALSCVNSSRGQRKLGGGITQPRVRSFGHPCILHCNHNFSSKFSSHAVRKNCGSNKRSLGLRRSPQRP